MRDWGWQDRAEWNSQQGFGRDERRQQNHFGSSQKTPVWGEWEDVTEEYFGTRFWELYVTRMESMKERKEEKEWENKVAVVLPLIRDIASKNGCTVTLYAAMDRLEGRKPKSRWRAASGDMVALWRGMSVEQILDHVEAHLRASDCPDDGEVLETRVVSAGVIPQNNPFAALKGKF